MEGAKDPPPLVSSNRMVVVGANTTHCSKRGVEGVQKNPAHSFRATGVFEPSGRVEKKNIIKIRHNKEVYAFSLHQKRKIRHNEEVYASSSGRKGKFDVTRRCTPPCHVE